MSTVDNVGFEKTRFHTHENVGWQVHLPRWKRIIRLMTIQKFVVRSKADNARLLSTLRVSPALWLLPFDDRPEGRSNVTPR